MMLEDCHSKKNTLLAYTLKSLETNKNDNCMVIFCLGFNKQSLPEDQSAELATIVSHRGQAVVVDTFDSSTREECKMRRDRS